ncbi:hypothetical protein C5167_027770 [Papaver somniferum]|uniref:uncharacterized protein LOC113339984 isoform X2 n=1 Tax=Papaver somniferum TaxID=3469 RepID=UPI000E700E44|nr:uncharacterized protein LOC113339984 isoform X2 [Papaver somniferum]RZC91702.1 hypothetical protein C5167_027770 [Papaver somniferum]
MSAARLLALDDADHPSHEHMIEIKELLKMLAESQAKLAEAQAKQAEFQVGQAKSQAKLAETQANTQQQIIGILSRSTNGNARSNNHKQQEEEYASNNAKEEITHDLDGNDDESPSENQLKGGYQAKFVFGKHDLLVEALREDDLQKASDYLVNNPEAINEAISEELHTILHKAVDWNIKMTFIEEIVKSMTPDILEYKTTSNYGGDNAVHIAAFRGYTEAVVTMVSKNSKLAQIRNDDGFTPLEIALLYVTPGQKAMVEYLYSVIKDVEPSPFLGSHGAKLLCYAIDAGFYDMALCLVKGFPELITEKSVCHKMCGLELLVRKQLAFPSGSKLTWLQNLVYSLIQVEMDSKYVLPVEPNTCWSTDFTNTDEEKPPVSSKRNKADECYTVFSTTSNGILMPYLARAPYIMNVYKQKLMHEQAIALLKQMLVGLKNAKKLNATIAAFFKENPDIIKEAMKLGATEFVMEFLERFGFLIWHDIPDQKMIQMAIAEKNVNMVNLLCDCGDAEFEDKITLLSVIDKNDNTILHHAAKLVPYAKLNSVSCVALQIQRELQWFKGVQNMLTINYKARKNKEGYTAQSIFTKEHRELVKEGEKWMKDTSGSCMLVAALIATVAFAAAVTVPGGNISDYNSSKNGTPVFLRKTSFKVFTVADALALFSSITSVLMFLAINTSRYAEIDFLKSLPEKVILGFTTLFISMAAMLVAFCASLFIMVGDKSPLSLILIALFGSVPVTLFVWLQLPLYCEMVRSTYWGSLFEQHRYIDPRVKKITTKRKRV